MRVLLLVTCMCFIGLSSTTPCGKSYCNYDEICEKSIGGGTCFKKSQKRSCNSFYYCYTPTTCCGFGTCCPEGSKCENSRCIANAFSSAVFRWYYAVAGIVPLIILICCISCICVRRRRANANAATGMQARAPAGNPGSPYANQPNVYSVQYSNAAPNTAGHTKHSRTRK